MDSAVAPDALLARRSRALIRHLPAAAGGDPAAVHRARVASRRIRELLPILGQAPKTAKRVRKVTRALGRVRELDVALALLDTDELSAGVPRATLAAVRAHVRAGRDERAAEMASALREIDAGKLARRLERAADSARAEGARLVRQRLAARLTRRARTMRDAIAAAGPLYVPGRLHDVRLASKKLRYALEIAAELGAAEAAPLAARVRRVQIALGQLQDRTVLLREIQRMADGERAPAGVRRLVARVEQACRRLHADYLAGRDDMADVFARVRRDIVPALTRAGRSVPLRASLGARPRAGARGARR